MQSNDPALQRLDEASHPPGLGAGLFCAQR